MAQLSDQELEQLQAITEKLYNLGAKYGQGS